VQRVPSPSYPDERSEMPQQAFGWDDDHLYSFWLSGTFWGAEDAQYLHPLPAASIEPPGRSA